MKKAILFTAAAAVALLAGCEKYEERIPEGYAHHYYVMYNYNFDANYVPTLNNATISVNRDSQTPIELQVKFTSMYVRDYDVECRLYVRNSPYFLRDIGVSTAANNYAFQTPDSLALPGIDFNLLDENMELMTPVRGDTVTYYTVVFPKAERGVRKIYVKPLNNEDYPHFRCAWLSFSPYRVVPNVSEEEVKRTALNTETSKYKVSTISNSYMRRINIR